MSDSHDPFGDDPNPDVSGSPGGNDPRAQTGGASNAEPAKAELAERNRAVAHGKALGEDEATRRGETGDERAQRVGRAMAYAAWAADGKPEGRPGDYLAEFGVTGHDVVESEQRAAFTLLLGGDKKKKERA